MLRGIFHCCAQLEMAIITEPVSTWRILYDPADASLKSSSTLPLILHLLRGYAAAVASEPVPVERLSSEQIFADLHEELVGLHRVLRVDELLDFLTTENTEGTTTVASGFECGRVVGLFAATDGD